MSGGCLVRRNQGLVGSGFLRLLHWGGNSHAGHQNVSPGDTLNFNQSKRGHLSSAPDSLWHLVLPFL